MYFIPILMPFGYSINPNIAVNYSNYTGGIFNFPYQTFNFGNNNSNVSNNNFNNNSNVNNLFELYKKSFNTANNNSQKPFFGKDYAEDFKIKTDTMKNIPETTLQNAGYNATKGQKLANIARKNTVGFSGKCATYVKRDIEKAGLGEYVQGDAYQCADILSKNPNFKEISTKNLDLEKLPAGCILVYDKGVSGYNKDYGHIEITDGRGFACSDGTTANIRTGARVFIPV
jgi:hypothetical protein